MVVFETCFNKAGGGVRKQWKITSIKTILMIPDIQEIWTMGPV